MTDEEALNLKEGQRVILGCDRGKPMAQVLYIPRPEYHSGRLRVRVRRIGRAKDGRRYGSRWEDPFCLEIPHDPAPANVYADFLEENGFTDAATALRKAFPLGTSE